MGDGHVRGIRVGGWVVASGLGLLLLVSGSGDARRAEGAQASKVVIRVAAEASFPDFTVTWPMKFKELVEAKTGGQV